MINIGNTEEVTIRALAERVRDLAGSSSPIKFVPYDEAYESGFEDMPRRVPDLTKVARDDRLRAAPRARRHPRADHRALPTKVRRAHVAAWTLHGRRVYLGHASSGAFLLAAAVLSWAAPAHAEVQLRIENGLVSLKATNATAREILAEWARVGQTRIVNAERVPGGPITIELTDVTEEQALDIILRSAAGYVAAPRADCRRQRVALRSHPGDADELADAPDAAAARPPRSRSRSFRRSSHPRFRRSSRVGSSRRSSRRSFRDSSAGERRRRRGRAGRSGAERGAAEPRFAAVRRHAAADAAGAAAAVKPVREPSGDRNAAGGRVGAGHGRAGAAAQQQVPPGFPGQPQEP